MPDFIDYKKDKETGKMYCWDSDIKKFCEVIINPLALSAVPPSIITAFIKESGNGE
jgi:hypothetical protein